MYRRNVIRRDSMGQDVYKRQLLDGASAEFDQDLVSKGELSPVFFGSALTNCGVEICLKHFLKMTTSPLPRTADIGVVDPIKEMCIRDRDGIHRKMNGFFII